MTTIHDLTTHQGEQIIKVAQRLMATGKVPRGDWSRALKLASVEITRRASCN